MTTLDDLLEAIRSGTVQNVTAWLDNDNVSFTSDDSDEEVLTMHPYEVLKQSLTALGITPEAV
jgi:hypothetical protein